MDSCCDNIVKYSKIVKFKLHDQSPRRVGRGAQLVTDDTLMKHNATSFIKDGQIVKRQLLRTSLAYLPEGAEWGDIHY